MEAFNPVAGSSALLKMTMGDFHRADGGCYTLATLSIWAIWEN
jgi:hypothetical protein